MTEEQQAIIAEIVEELKSQPPQRKKRRSKAEMALAKGEAGTAIVPVKDDYKIELTAWEAEAKDLLETLALCEIETQSDMDEMGRIQRASFEKWKVLEDKRKHLKEPALEMGRRIDNEFKIAQGLCKAIEKAAAQRQESFRLAAARAQDLALAAVAASGGQADAATLVVAHGANVLALPETSREIVTWIARVRQPNLITDEKYWRRVLNIELIQAEADVLGSALNIPGVEVERQVQIVNKAVR